MSEVRAGSKLNLWNEIQLIDEIHKIVKAYNDLVYSNEPGKKIWYGSAYPDWIFDKTGDASLANDHTRLICYDIVKKDDGSIGPERYDRNKRVRPIVMEQKSVVVNQGEPDQKTQVAEIYMKHYDITLRFDCLAPSDRESLVLIRDFERMLEIHAKYLETGCSRFVYDGRRPSYFNRDIRYKSRTCQFFAQVQEQWHTLDDRIERINIEYLHATKHDIENAGIAAANA